MERRSFIKHAGLAGILAAGSAPVFAQAQPEVKWRLASSFPRSLDTIFGGADVISKRVASATNNKFQIQVFAGGEIVPAFGVVDAVQNATVQCAHTAPYYFFGKDPTFAFALRDPVRHERAPAERLDVSRRRPGADARVLQGLQHHQLPGGQHRRADGRLVPQGDQDGRRLQGPQDAHRRHRRPAAAEARRGAAADSRRRHLPGAGKGHDRRGRMGRPVRRREARLLQGREELLLPGLVGRRSRARPLRQHQGVRGAAEGVPVDPGSRMLRGQHRHDGQVRRAQSAGAAQAAGGRREAAAVLQRHHGGVLQGHHRGLRRDRQPRTPSSTRSTARGRRSVPTRSSGSRSPRTASTTS